MDVGGGTYSWRPTEAEPRRESQGDLPRAGGKLVEPLRGGLASDCLASIGESPCRRWRLASSLRAHAPKLADFLFHANVATRLAAPLAKVPWVLSGNRVAEHEKRWHLTLDRLTSNLATGSVCVSKGVLQFTRDVEGVSPKRLVVIANGVDTAAFDRAEPLSRDSIGIPKRAHLALCIGRLEVQKGLPYLFEAAERVIASCPDWYLLLVGDGPERDWVRRRIDETPALTGRVQWLGRRDDIPKLLKAADVLVLSSLGKGCECGPSRRWPRMWRPMLKGVIWSPNESGWPVAPRHRGLEAASERSPPNAAALGEAGRLQSRTVRSTEWSRPRTALGRVLGLTSTHPID